jgi:hypothetical protein
MQLLQSRTQWESEVAVLAKAGFLDHVDLPEMPDQCWLWQGYSDGQGYGRLKVPGKLHAERAHRVAWYLAHGRWPDKMVICHTCDVRLCVRPSHLVAAEQAENVADMRAKGRAMACCGTANPNSSLQKGDKETIFELRARGLTQRQIAAQFQLNQSTVSRILNGIHHAREGLHPWP